MTRKQAEVLAFVAWFIENTGGISPSFEEIAASLKTTSRGNVHRYIRALEELGVIRVTKGRARSIQIIDPGEVKLNDAVFKLLQQYAKAEEMSVDGAVNQIVRDALERAA
jgi:SOS-response transcriptional repressor LexA